MITGTKHSKKRRYRTSDEWQEIVNTYQTSSLKKTAYCQSKGVTVGNFNHWYKKFNADEKSARPTSSPESIMPFIALQAEQESAIAAEQQAVDNQLCEIALNLPGGVKLTLQMTRD